MDNEQCEGCRAYIDGLEDCPLFNLDISCPCVKCVVKVMCNDPCEEWSKWYDAKGILYSHYR